MEDGEIYRAFTWPQALGQLLGMGIHRKKDNLPLKGLQMTAFLRSQPQLNDGLQAAHSPLGSPLQRVLPSPALGCVCLWDFLPWMFMDFSNSTSTTLTPLSWHLLLNTQGSQQWQQPGILRLPHSPHYLTWSSVHSTSWTSLIQPPLTISIIHSLVQAPTAWCLPCFPSGLLTSQHETLPSLPTEQPVWPF